MHIREQVRAAVTAIRTRVMLWRAHRMVRKYGWVAGIVATLLFIPFYIILLPAPGFPTGQLVSIPADSTSVEIAEVLAREHVVRSVFEFHAFTRLTGQDRALQSGIYVFNHPLGLWEVSTRIANGDHGIAESRVTLTEGMTARDMAATLAAGVPGFDETAFLSAASTSEGYLFPDTYFVLPGTTAGDMVERLRSEFDTRIAKIQDEIDAFGAPLDEVVIMASILEREAQGEIDQRMVAGILYNRLRLGMPLQVDAAFGYAHGQNGYTPTSADLEGNSPYNTYRNKGLPPTAISNPGIEALEAAVTPTKSNYLYYLTGRDGTMHYAKTFEEHKVNRAKYLD